MTQSEELRNKIESIEKKFAAYLIVVEESLSIIHDELGYKQTELVEMETRYSKVKEEKEVKI